MPANRRPVDRQAKRDALVRVAAELFTAEGYDATPMSKLARAAGVTTNTVYWYFEDKDALLVAVLDLLLAEALQEHAQQEGLTWHEQLMWAVARLERFRELVSVVHVRAGSSAVVAAWHDQFHGLADALLADGFRQAGVAGEDLPAASRIGAFVIEGLLTHPQDEADHRAVLRLLTAFGSHD